MDSIKFYMDLYGIIISVDAFCQWKLTQQTPTSPEHVRHEGKPSTSILYFPPGVTCCPVGPASPAAGHQDICRPLPVILSSWWASPRNGYGPYGPYMAMGFKGGAWMDWHDWLCSLGFGGYVILSNCYVLKLHESSKIDGVERYDPTKLADGVLYGHVFSFPSLVWRIRSVGIVPIGSCWLFNRGWLLISFSTNHESVRKGHLYRFVPVLSW